MSIKLLGGILIVMLTVTSVANSQARTPVIDRREIRQQRRINQGVRSGQLTRNEARHLRADERKLNRDRRLAKADDVVTRAERAHLRREENRISRAIYCDKHNGRLRG